VWEASSGRCLLTLEGHEDWVMSCSWSPDGTRLASASRDSTVKVWETCSGRCLLTLQGHQDWVRSCSWSPDGTRLASAADDPTVKVWEATSGRCLLTLQGHQGSVVSCSWSPDGTELASAAFDGTVKVWEASSGRCVWTGHLLGDSQVATIGEKSRITSVSPEAWRFLAWRWFDPALGRYRLLPAETFGPLPSGE
jgi:WD40 repeat protein